MVWEIRDCFDVWGNEKDGWEVNDTYSAGVWQIPEETINDDKRLLEFLVAHTHVCRPQTAGNWKSVATMAVSRFGSGRASAPCTG